MGVLTSISHTQCVSMNVTEPNPHFNAGEPIGNDWGGEMKWNLRRFEKYLRFWFCRGEPLQICTWLDKPSPHCSPPDRAI